MNIRAGAIVLPLAVILSCGACASPPPSGGLSLADTKSPVQLLRNESVLRLPAEHVGTVDSTDESVGCDGDESIRRWESAASITLAGEAAANPDLAMTTLAASFEEDGWVVSPGNEREADEQAVLTSGTSAAEIRLIARTSGATPSITIEAAGPCVQTEGADSDEVTRLEVGDGE